MANLYRVDSPIKREQRNNINATFEDILKRFAHIQRQINLLAGEDVEQLIQSINDTIENAKLVVLDLIDETTLVTDQKVAEVNAALGNLSTQLTSALQQIETARANANDAATNANEKAGLAQTVTTNAEAATTDAITAKGAAIVATNNAIEATTQANTARDNANSATTAANDAAASANTAKDNAIAATNGAVIATENASVATTKAIEAIGTAVTATSEANNARDNALQAVQSVINAIETMQADIRATKNAFAHKGEYSASVQYYKDNEVSFNGSTYRAVQDTLGNPPDPLVNNEYWLVVARRGVDGSGAVHSINNQVGDVVLGPSTIGAASEADLSTLQQTVTQNHNDVTTQLAQTNQQLADTVKRVEEFRINGEVDETQQLQRAFNFVKEEVLKGHRVELNFKNGKTYSISAPLDFTHYNSCTITGSAKISVSGSVTTPLPYMIDMRETAQNLYRTGRVTLRDLTFDAKGKAEKIIEAWGYEGRGLYYATIARCFFFGIKEDGYAIHGVSWQTTIDNCFFVGEGYAESTRKGIAVRLGNYSNQVTFDKNEFNSLQHAVVRDTGGYGKSVFKHNVFEAIKHSAVKLEGNDFPTIEDNYFEDVGGVSDNVLVLGGATVPVDACIVIVGSRTNWDLAPYNVSIKRNQFASCRAIDIVAFDRGHGLEMKDNAITNKTTPHNSLVKLLKFGFGYYNRHSNYGAVIEGNKIIDYNSSNMGGLLLVSKIIDIGDLSPMNTVDFFTGVTLSKVVIKDVASIDPMGRKKKLPVSLYIRNFTTDATYTDFFTITKEIINGENVYNFLRTSASSKMNFIDIHGSFLERLKGTYVRFSFETANTQSGAGVRFEVTDGVKSLLYLPNGGQTDKTLVNNYVSMEFIFYVDPLATRLGFRINSFCSAGQSIQIKNFSVVPSTYGLEQYVEMI